uniref:RING-CH-type domain-containing protein n=1 Tax=Oryza meridionalis TaxID=40149 RepID=A0A0E0DUJ3_9ORYZ
MADHFAVMAGRLLTESTVQSAIDEASAAAVPSSVIASEHNDVQDEREKSGVLVECRICQEEDDQTYMETPCSCRGSLKYAHRKCIQRWCDEKGDTICEICLQQYRPNYTAPAKLFQHGRNSIFFRTPGYIQAQVMQNTDRSAAASTSYDPELPNPKGVIYCRIVALTLMVLLLLHDAISVFLGDHDAYTVAMITLLMLRTAGIVIPVYIILLSVTELLHRRNQRQISDAAAAVNINQQAPQSPRRQHVISIQ